MLAERVIRVQERIEAGGFMDAKLDEELIRQLHSDFCGDLTPEWAGRWRTIQVQVGTHTPPPPHEVPLRMREYALDLHTRLESSDQLESLPETLAFAEGRLLTVHPFADFNGRLTRLWLWELLRRLQLPPVELAPATTTATNSYLTALRAADRADFAQLSEIWRARLEARGAEPT